jgi:hypothetical protein
MIPHGEGSQRLLQHPRAAAPALSYWPIKASMRSPTG